MTPAPPPPPAPKAADPGAPLEAGVRVIIGYKLAKAALWVALATALGLLATTGRLDHFAELAHPLERHLASRWSLLAGELFGSILSRRGLRLVEVGLTLDALLSGVEAWALWRGHRWGPWLVALATALPIPLELAELARRPGPWRVLLLAVNVAVVTYLVRWLRRHPRAPAPPAAP